MEKYVKRTVKFYHHLLTLKFKGEVHYFVKQFISINRYLDRRDIKEMVGPKDFQVLADEIQKVDKVVYQMPLCDFILKGERVEES